MPAFGTTFEDLKALFDPYLDRLTVTADTPAQFTLEAGPVSGFRRPIFFGGVRAGRNYVSFHFMPIYSNPELMGGISDALRRRLHGKSCFNFVTPEPELYEELRDLIARGFACYERLGYVK